MAEVQTYPSRFLSDYSPLLLRVTSPSIYPFYFWYTFKLFLHIDVPFELLKKKKILAPVSWCPCAPCAYISEVYIHSSWIAGSKGMCIFFPNCCTSWYSHQQHWVFRMCCCFTLLPTPGIVRLQHFCQFVDYKWYLTVTSVCCFSDYQWG